MEEEYNGERKKKRKLRWFTSYDKAMDAGTPEDKLLPAKMQSMYDNLPKYEDGFMNIPDDIDEEVPFN